MDGFHGAETWSKTLNLSMVYSMICIKPSASGMVCAWPFAELAGPQLGGHSHIILLKEKRL
jgi:hypothetical protein